LWKFVWSFKITFYFRKMHSAVAVVTDNLKVAFQIGRALVIQQNWQSWFLKFLFHFRALICMETGSLMGITKLFLVSFLQQENSPHNFQPALTLRGPNRGHHPHPGRDEIPDAEERDSPDRELCLPAEKPKDELSIRLAIQRQKNGKG
jgi:hypothetical protein